MFADYELEVLKDYREKKDGGELLNNMMHPTPGKLRDEGLAAFDLRYDKKDERALRSFYELTGDTDSFRAVIKKWERDKFKMLNLVLNGRQVNTDEKNIELLAWLIDFKPRPYAIWLNERKEKTSVDIVPPEETEMDAPQPTAPGNNHGSEETVDQSGGQNEQEDIPIEPGQSGKPDFSYRKAVSYVALIMAVLLVGYFMLKRQPFTEGNCMYWTGDHYERIACNERRDDTTAPVIGFDSNKMVHFKRITRADTLSAASLGKVWYIKLPGGLEYYIAPGEHPLYPDRRLLPITLYILNKYPRKAG